MGHHPRDCMLLLGFTVGAIRQKERIGFVLGRRGTSGLLPSGLAIDKRNLRRHGDNCMAWETPSFEEIEMNAEIGSYQGDYDDPDYDGL